MRVPYSRRPARWWVTEQPYRELFKLVIFSNTPGVVAAVVSGPALPFAISIGGNGTVPSFPTAMLSKAILTGFRFGGKSGLGINHTLRDRIYVYVFGERAGEVAISGIAFAGVCNAIGNWVGFDSVHAYYERVRVSTSGAPVRLILGPRTTLAGFMHELDFNLEDPTTGVGSFSFRFVAMPRVAHYEARIRLPWEPLS